MELTILALAMLAMVANAADRNPVFNPCAQLPSVGGKDSISIAIAYAGSASVWYNQSNVYLNQISPCDNRAVAQVPTTAKVAVFRPLLDQISMLRTNNASYLELLTSFPGNASVVAYAGNPTVVSEPRYFLVPYGRIPIYTLVIELKKGVLVNLRWKDEKCTTCAKNSDACFRGACATSEATCRDPLSTISSASGADPCRFAINAVFSGTDKYNQVMNSWFEVKSIEQYSLTSLFGLAGNALSQFGLSIIDDDLGG